MKYVDEFRDGELAKTIAARIREAADPARPYHFMEFCGGHTHAISRYGVKDLLPPNVRHGARPGLPGVRAADRAHRRGDRPGASATRRDPVHLRRHDARAGLGRAVAHEGQGEGRGHPHGVFGRGRAAHRARGAGARSGVLRHRLRDDHAAHRAGGEAGGRRWASTNFSVFCNHVLTPSAIAHILESPEVRDLGTVVIDGFVGPAHVSTIIGSQPYEYFAEEYRKPVVIAGFEPLDVMQAILMLVRQVNEGRAEVENEFTRAVTREGNEKAKALVADVFELRRALRVARARARCPTARCSSRTNGAAFDAERRFDVRDRSVPDNKACECGAILRGVKKPTDCKVFGTACTPETPDRLVHGVLRRRVRRALHLRPVFRRRQQEPTAA